MPRASKVIISIILLFVGVHLLWKWSLTHPIRIPHPCPQYKKYAVGKVLHRVDEQWTITGGLSWTNVVYSKSGKKYFILRKEMINGMWKQYLFDVEKQETIIIDMEDFIKDFNFERKD